MSAPGPLAGQVAVVTGGGRGLGRAAALALAGQGAAVAVTGRTPGPLDAVVAEVAAAGGRALAVPGDATDRGDVADAFRRAAAELGAVDLVVANAGRFATGGPVWQSDPDEWWRDVEVNLRSVQLCLWAALPAMVERGRGRVVAVGSGFGERRTSHASAYSASKAALMRLVDATALELAGTGVSVFTVSPGVVATDMTTGFPEGFLAAHPDFADPDFRSPQDFTRLLARIAAGDVDALSGRFLHVTHDLHTAIAAAARDADAGALRAVPYDA